MTSGPPAVATWNQSDLAKLSSFTGNRSWRWHPSSPPAEKGAAFMNRPGQWQLFLVGALLAGCGPAPADEIEVSLGDVTSGSVHVIKAVSSGLCLDVTRKSTAAGANVAQWTCNGQTNQQFRLTDTGGGLLELRPMNSGNQCLDVFQSSLLDGGNVDQWTCNGHSSQRFKLIDKGSGRFEIQALNSGKCLNVAGGSTLRGANIEQRTCQGAANQEFTLTAVAGGVPTSGGGGGTGGTGGSSSTGGGGTGGSAGDSSGAPSAAQLLALTSSCLQASNGLYATDDGSTPRVPICKLNGAFFWHSDMDIDCDGVVTSACNSSTDPDFQDQTSATTSSGSPMNSVSTPYFVIPLPSSRFDYTRSGIQLGQVGAVIFNGKVVYGVFADEGPSNIIGEGSHALAQALGIDANPATGGVDSGVTFIVFTGSSGVVSPIEDHSKATAVGIARANAALKDN
jgi:hypothetical protein